VGFGIGSLLTPLLAARLGTEVASNVIARLSAICRYEGPAYSVCATPAAGRTPVYRFYNRRTGTHLYTASEDEKASVAANLGAIHALDAP
jgi:hypothetical protein